MFPEDRDRRLIAYADRLQTFAADLSDWAARRRPHDDNTRRSATGSDSVTIEQLRRTAANLLEAARHPAAAAVYGPSQAGKSLFADRMLTPRDPERSPLGRDERHAAPGYLPGLSFNVDLNPQSGSNEATALVTRFTAGDRLPADLPPQFPVLARALTRGQLLRVLARGFAMECIAGGPDWNETTLAAAIDELGKRYPAATPDVAWSRDLAGAYATMQTCEPRRYVAPEDALVAALARAPLTGEGYVALAARMFWDDWRSLTGLFLRVNEFLAGIRPAASEASELLVDWAAARFLLDGKRALVHERRGSRCFQRVEWADVRLVRCGSRPALEYCPGACAYREPLETIQAAMLELVVPVLPERLNDDWRHVLMQNDVLDVPGLRAGRQGAEQGKRRSADTLDEQLEILKRGKVAYLFEHYTEQLQIQTLLLLVRGGNLEVTGSLKHHVDCWGRARYGADSWPNGVSDNTPALFIGLTGIDEEFRQRTEFAEPSLYDARLAQLVDALGDVAVRFGGEQRPFTNIYPLRYPGLWDASAEQQRREGDEKWTRAGQAFLGSSLVRRHVDAATERWSAALRDDDGGWSAIRRGFLELTTAERKQDHVERQLRRTHERLSALARQWIVNTDGRAERERRETCGRQILDWLTSEPRLIYRRVEALRQALCLQEGDQYALSDVVEYEPRSAVERRNGADDRVGDALRSFWQTWADGRVATLWDRFTRDHPEAKPWPTPDQIGRLSTYLKDYFCSPSLCTGLAGRLLQIVGLQLNDECARREARRRYVRLLLNDVILAPGMAEPRADGNADLLPREFGLMTPLVRRWQRRLPQALGAGVGDVAEVPPGNEELIQLVHHHALSSNSAGVVAPLT